MRCSDLTEDQYWDILIDLIWDSPGTGSSVCPF